VQALRMQEQLFASQELDLHWLVESASLRYIILTSLLMYIKDHAHLSQARSVSTTFKPAVGKFGKQVATPKTTPSSGNVNAEWTHDLHGVNNPASQRGVQQRFGRNGRGVRGDRLNKALNGGTFASGVSNQFNVVGNSKPNSGMSIRGLAGPCCIRAQNFAPGTTAADIESAMTPIGGKVLKCSIVTNVPTVVAEIVFESKEGADMVIETFNNQTVSIPLKSCSRH
jgi:hypothetical protein